MARYVVPIPNPAVIYLTAVVYATFSGGVSAGLVSGFVTLLYALYFFSSPGQFFHYTTENLFRVIVLALSTPAMVVMVGSLKRRSERAAALSAGNAILQEQLAKRKSTEEVLREREEQYRLIVENIDDVVYRGVDGADMLHATMQFVSSQTESILGYKPEEFLQDPSLWFSLVHPDDRPALMESTQRIFATRAAGTREYRLRHKHTGEYRWMEDKIVPLVDAQNRTYAFQGAARDISERRHAEAALRQSEERYRTLFEQAADGIFVSDAEGNHVDVNASGCAMVGYTREEILRLNLIDLIPEKDRAQAPPRFDELRAGKTLMRERQLRRKDGTRLPVEIRTRMLPDGRMQAIVRDIGERKRAEETLSKLSSAVEQTADNVFICSRKGIIEYVNPAFEQLTGYTKEEAIGSTARILKSGAHDLAFYQDLWNTILGGDVFRAEFTNRKKSGELYYEEKTLTPIRDNHGNLTHFVSTGKDVTERKHAEQQLQRRADEFAALYETVHDLALQQDLPTLLQTIIERASALIEASVGAMYLYDAKQQQLELVGAKGLQLPRGLRLQVGEGLAGRVAQTHEPLIVDDYRQWPHRSPQLEEVAIRAVVGVPMLAQRGGELIGVLIMDIIGESERKFTAADARLLTLFASQVASAVHNARLFEETRQRLAELEAVNKISTILRVAQTLDEMLPLLLDEMLAVLGCDAGAVSIYDEAHDELVPLVLRGWFRNTTAKLKPHEGIAGHVFASGEVYATHEFATDPRVLNSVRSQVPRDWSGVCVPIRSASSIVGVLFAAVALPRELIPNEVHLLTTLAEIAGSAIQRARLFEQMQHRTDEFAALYETVHDLTLQQDLPTLLQTIIERASALVQTSVGGMYLYNASQQQLELVVMKDMQLPLGLRLHTGEGLAGQVAQTREPLIVNDYQQWGYPLPQLVELGVKAVVGVPMLAQRGGELIGVLITDIRGESERKFTAADARLLTLFASQAASAVHNARLLAETRQRLGELEAVNKVSTALRVAQTLDEMLPLLLDETLMVLGSDTGAVWIHDEAHAELVPMVARGWFRDTLAKTKPHEGIAGHVFATGETYLTREFATDSRLRESVRPQVPRGWGGACVPIRSVNSIVGVLFVAVALPRELTPSELRLLHTLSEIAGNAIHRTHLREQTEQRLGQLAALRVIDSAINSSVDLLITFEILLAQALNQLHADAAAVLLLKPHSRILEYVAGRGFRTKAIERSRIRIGEGVAGRAVLAGSTSQIPNLAEMGSAFTRANLLADEQFITYHATPLLAKGQVKGVLEVFHRAAFNPDADWLDFLEALAGQAAIAVDNTELFRGLQRSNLELNLAYETTLEGWSHALDLRDKETEGHTQRVSELTVQLAHAMGMSEETIVQVRRGALLHDMGKMGVPDAILLKPGKLTDDEWVVMRKHPVYAYDLLYPIEYLRPALDIPYCHHEKWDGTGYPRGLKGEQIPLAARLFAVIDVWDALCSDRPYRAGWPEEKVREHIRSLSGTHFDPHVVEVFLPLM
jgi:PAS domain S-box-containing protein